jgi:hypothetical protein
MVAMEGPAELSGEQRRAGKNATGKAAVTAKSLKTGKNHSGKMQFQKSRG